MFGRDCVYNNTAYTKIGIRDAVRHGRAEKGREGQGRCVGLQYVYVYMCVYIYIYIYTHIDIYTRTCGDLPSYLNHGTYEDLPLARHSGAELHLRVHCRQRAYCWLLPSIVSRSGFAFVRAGHSLFSGGSDHSALFWLASRVDLCSCVCVECCAHLLLMLRDWAC